MSEENGDPHGGQGAASVCPVLLMLKREIDRDREKEEEGRGREE